MPKQRKRRDKFPGFDENGKVEKLTPTRFKRVKTIETPTYEEAFEKAQALAVPEDGKLRIKRLSDHFAVCLFKPLEEKKQETKKTEKKKSDGPRKKRVTKQSRKKQEKKDDTKPKGSVVSKP